jgi:peptidoglycan-N-acetylglucosamine deacetylase
MIKVFCVFMLMLASYQCVGQDFKNKKCAVVLTYDDALNVHLDNAIPLLDSLGFKATFYLTAFFPGCKDRLEDWKKAAIHGHELGNHTLFHPCIGDGPGRAWVSAERNLNRYTMSGIVEEILMNNIFLQSLDGKSKRTFAYPCGDLTVNDSSYADKIAPYFVASRGVKSEMLPPARLDFNNVGSFAINGHTGEQMITLVKEAIKNKTAIVFLFHGVGGEHSLNVGLREHKQLLLFLKEHESEILVAPFIEVMEHLKSTVSKK